jgi:uncharacterized Zn finger protein
MARKRRNFYGSYDYSYFPPSIPRNARGGIKAQSKRGVFGETWWAKRWIEVLESFHIGARLGRGRSYARRGQVLSIDIEKGKVSARVQGSSARPYHVTIKVKVIGMNEWKKLAGALSRKAVFAAKLLAGEMPEGIEEAFHESGLSLFPDKRTDITTDCSCPDWSNPCKHIAAVFYLLGEEFDRDPFLIFKLRGMDREELMGLVGGRHSAKSRKVRTEIEPASEGRQEAQAEAEPLSADPGLFWGQELPADEPGGEVHIPGLCAALPKQLGSFPFWRGQESFLSTLEALYRRASPGGMAVFLGERRLPGKT